MTNIHELSGNSGIHPALLNTVETIVAELAVEPSLGVTYGFTPFQWDLHIGDHGHTLIAGPSGSGKRILLNLLAIKWLAQPDARVIAFDAYRSLYAFTESLGGAYHDTTEDLANADTSHRFSTFALDDFLRPGKDVQGIVITRLLQQIEQTADGRPTLILFDERMTYHPAFQFPHETLAWLGAMRKKKVTVVFPVQALTDLKNSPLLPAIREHCRTHIFLPNPSAAYPVFREAYADFGLGNEEIHLLRSLDRRKYAYISSASGHRFVNFDFCPATLGLYNFSLAWIRNRVD